MTIHQDTMMVCAEGSQCEPLCVTDAEAAAEPTLSQLLLACEDLGINPFRFLAAHELRLAQGAPRTAR